MFALPTMVHLGYGRHVRADKIYGLVPIEPEHRGDGRRTFVYVEGIAEPLVASRSERAILEELEHASVDPAAITSAPRRTGLLRRGPRNLA
jgi:hypothetical protein